MAKLRDLSPVEAGYLAADTPVKPVFVNQFVIEGRGAFDIEQWRAAIIKAANVNPGITARLKGSWGNRFWDDGGNYPALHLYNSSWTGNNDEDIPFMNYLDCKSGPCAEVHLLQSEKAKVVFRTHHALCDGVAHLHWMQEVFRALRGEPLTGSRAEQNEWDVVQAYSVAKNKIPVRQWNTIGTQSMQQNPPEYSAGVHWQTFRYQGDCSKVLSKIIYTLAEIGWENRPDANFNIRIPSNLRRLVESDAFLFGNLTGAFDFTISSEQKADNIYKYLLNAKRKNLDLSVFPRNMHMMNWLPAFLFRTSDAHFKKMYQQGACNISAITSYLGKVELDLFSHNAFKAERVFGIPLALEGVSLSLGMMLINNSELSGCISAPKSLASREQLQQLVAQVTHRLHLDNNAGSTMKRRYG